MTTRRKRILAAAVVAVLAVGGITYAVVAGGSSNASKPLVVLSSVQRRTLQSTVALTGTLAHNTLRTVSTTSAATVTSLEATDGGSAKAGDTLFSLDGRASVAEPGQLPFFRSLSPGDVGQDVLELKQILAAAGDYPGTIDTVFTDQTQLALAQWQAQHDYPNSSPATATSVTVSLGQGTGYKLGPQTSAGLIIGPTAGKTASGAPSTPAGASASGGGGAGAGASAGASALASAASDQIRRGDQPVDATLTDYTPQATVAVAPVLSIQSENAVVSEGQPATFVIMASTVSTTALTVDLATGGSATTNDIVAPPSQVVLPAGQGSVTVPVPTRVDNVVKPTKTLTLTLEAGSGYAVGAMSSAQTSITNQNVPALQISGGVTVSPGGSAILTVTANQAPLQTTQVEVTLSGSALPGTAYQNVNPVLTLAAGATSTSVTINTIDQHVLQPNLYLVASLTPSPGNYTVAQPSAAVITIAGASGSAALPVVTLRSATTYLQKGQPYDLAVSLNEPLSTSLTISLSYGGTAVQGTDYTPPAGTIVVPAGETAAEVTIPTVLDNVVEPDRTLTVALAPSAAYQIGSPSTTAVTITSLVVPELNITASTSSLTEGGAATFTITANQAPAKATSVSYQVVGTAQPGQDYQPLTGTALLAAGQTQVTVTLQSIQKDVTFEPTDMIVSDWPTRIGQVYVKANASVAPGAPILELTDPNFTVTLQASASDRTQLAVGQTCTVQLVGSENQVTGTITELDADPTLVGGQEVYEGKIATTDLGAADGAAVSITVVDQQDTDVLSVPIAALKQNGTGQNVVRVFDFAAGGKIIEVPVRTGLSEGSYVAITHGLREGEAIVVEVEQP